MTRSLREKVKAPYYGGELVDQAVTSVFAALIWHCQDLREELVPQLVQQSAFSDFLRPSQLLQDAFSTAEALRRDLVGVHVHVLIVSLFIRCTMRCEIWAQPAELPW